MQATLRAGRFPNTATTRAMPMSLARFWLVCLFFLLWACIIAVRLFMLQVVHHSDYMERAVKQQQRTFEVAPHRGILYDRNLRELAMTVKVDSIYAVPSEIDDKKAAAHALAAIVHTNPDDSFTTESAIEDRLENGRSFAWVARRVTPETSARLHALDQKGLYFQKEDKLVPEELRGIGIRIEDDIVVTADGAVNLSAGLPRTADDVEAWMGQYL